MRKEPAFVPEDVIPKVVEQPLEDIQKFLEDIGFEDDISECIRNKSGELDYRALIMTADVSVE